MTLEKDHVGGTPVVDAGVDGLGAERGLLNAAMEAVLLDTRVCPMFAMHLSGVQQVKRLMKRPSVGGISTTGSAQGILSS